MLNFHHGTKPDPLCTDKQKVLRRWAKKLTIKIKNIMKLTFKITKKMIFKQITLPDNSTIYFIDNKRTSAQIFEDKNVLCNVQNKKTCISFSGFTKSGNRFFQCTKY